MQLFTVHHDLPGEVFPDAVRIGAADEERHRDDIGPRGFAVVEIEGIATVRLRSGRALEVELHGHAHAARTDPGQDRGVMLNSRMEMVLPKHGPTDGADSIPE